MERIRALRVGCPMNGRLLVVEEHPLTAAGLLLTLSGRDWHVETCTGPTALDVVEHAQRFEPACALLDVRLGETMGCGIELIGPLAATGAQVVMLTAERRRAVLAACLEAGAAGWISKGASLDEVDWALERLLDGETLVAATKRATLLDTLRLERASERRTQAIFEELTHRELLVLAALADGLSAEQIANAHYVALTTIRSQIRAVLQKLGVRSQLAAVAVAGDHRDLLPQRESSGNNRRRTDHGDRGSVPALAANIA